jgi:hypothetical protein
MGNISGFASGMRTCMMAMEEPDTELQRVDVLASLDQEKGRVR